MVCVILESADADTLAVYLTVDLELQAGIY